MNLEKGITMTDPMNLIARHAVAGCTPNDVYAAETVLDAVLSQDAHELREELSKLSNEEQLEAAQIVAVLLSLKHSLASAALDARRR